MASKKFEITVLLLILLIVASSIMLAWSFYNPYMKFGKFYFATLILVFSALLYTVIYKNKKSIYDYLEGLKFEESLSELKSKPIGNNELHNLINEIAKKFSTIKTEKEGQYQYFQSIIRNINIGILTFDSKGKIEHCNEALLKTLSISQVNHIDDLRQIKENFPETLKKASTNKHQLLKIERNNGLLNISVTASEFYIQGEKIKLISLQDIRNELQEQEIEAQQKLIRVLTHEIMNSVGPISSLSSTLFEEIEEAENIKTEEFMYNAKVGLSAIQKRSEGLGRFVEAYKSISNLPKPCFNECVLKNLLEQIEVLFKDKMQKENIDFRISLKDINIKLTADEKMIMQVFINIITNAIDALKNIDNKFIKIEAFEDFNSNIHISISNNGIPISNEIIGNIFLPFYTTKENGSGIGLSLSRQIMHYHKGSISIETGEITTFKLVF